MIDLNACVIRGRHRSQRCLAAAAAVRSGRGARRLAATARDWLPQLFPEARLSADRKTLRCADLSGRPPRKEGSCVIHLEGRVCRLGLRSRHRRERRPDRSDLPRDRADATRRCSRRRRDWRAWTGRRRQRARPPAEARSQPRSRAHPRRLPPARRNAGGDLPAGPGLERSRLVPICCSTRTSTDYDGERGWPGMVARPRDGERRADRRHPSHLPARGRLGQGAAGQEDAGRRSRAVASG